MPRRRSTPAVTGGFTLKNASIAGYNNHAAEWIIAIFIFLCGINFNLYYFLLMRRFRDVWKNEELRAYILICLTSTVLIAVNTYHMASGLGECVRDAFFQVTSIMSTTGFSTLDHNAWPVFSKTLIVLLTMIGACAGSAAGGAEDLAPLDLDQERYTGIQAYPAPPLGKCHAPGRGAALG